MENATTTVTVVDEAKVQHVTKKSSDELLSKFAELGSQDVNANKKKRDQDAQFGSPSSHLGAAAFVERRSLLPVPATRKAVMLRRLGRGKLRARDIRNKSLFGTIHKTWRRTIEGASRVFIEKHYHRHKRLINDIV